MKTLQKRIQLFFILLLMVLCSLFFLFATFYFNRVNTEKIHSDSRNLCESISYNMDAEIKLLNDISLEVIYYIYQNQSLLKNVSLEMNPASMLEIYNELSRILGPNLSASQINIYLENGLCIGSGFDARCMTKSAKELPYYKDVSKAVGSKYMVSLDDFPPQTRMYEHQFLLARTFQTASGNLSGMVEVLQNEQRLFRFPDNLKRKNGLTEILIFNKENGSLIYPNTGKSDELEKYYGYVLHNEPLTLNLFTNSAIQKTNLVIYDDLELYNWSIVILQPKHLLTLPFYQELFKLLLFLSVCFLLLLMVYGIFTRRILSPLKTLKENVENINIDTLLNDSLSFTSNSHCKTQEIRILNDTFENMYHTLQRSTKEIIVLKEKESNSNFRALQALTDPHFIYNSIAAISAMAENGRTKEIISFSENLCEIIRYTSNRTLNQVALRDELYITRQYLECMKLRYGTDLQYSIDVPDCILSIEIPKLTIQTLVENCIKHGFEITPPLCIRVKGERTDHGFRISVRDNGIGFDEETLKELQTEIHSAISSPGISEPCIGGSGIINVILRLCFKNQDTFYTITNNETNGCTITIGQSWKDEGENDGKEI